MWRALILLASVLLADNVYPQDPSLTSTSADDESVRAMIQEYLIPFQRSSASVDWKGAKSSGNNKVEQDVFIGKMQFSLSNRYLFVDSSSVVAHVFDDTSRNVHLFTTSKDDDTKPYPEYLIVGRWGFNFSPYFAWKCMWPLVLAAESLTPWEILDSEDNNELVCKQGRDTWTFSLENGLQARSLRITQPPFGGTPEWMSVYEFTNTKTPLGWMPASGTLRSLDTNGKPLNNYTWTWEASSKYRIDTPALSVPTIAPPEGTMVKDDVNKREWQIGVDPRKLSGKQLEQAARSMADAASLKSDTELRTKPEGAIPTGKTFAWQWYLMAATIIAVIAGGAFYFRSSRRGRINTLSLMLLGLGQSFLVSPTTATEIPCGVQATYVYLKSLGKEIELAEVASNKEKGKTEHSIVEIQDLIANFGVITDAYDIPADDLSKLKGPFILFHTVQTIDGPVGHFTCARFKNGNLHLYEPSRGEVVLSIVDFKQTIPHAWIITEPVGTSSAQRLGYAGLVIVCSIVLGWASRGSITKIVARKGTKQTCLSLLFLFVFVGCEQSVIKPGLGSQEAVEPSINAPIAESEAIGPLFQIVSMPSFFKPNDVDDTFTIKFRNVSSHKLTKKNFDAGAPCCSNSFLQDLAPPVVAEGEEFLATFKMKLIPPGRNVIPITVKASHDDVEQEWSDQIEVDGSRFDIFWQATEPHFSSFTSDSKENSDIAVMAASVQLSLSNRLVFDPDKLKLKPFESHHSLDFDPPTILSRDPLVSVYELNLRISVDQSRYDYGPYSGTGAVMYGDVERSFRFYGKRIADWSVNDGRNRISLLRVGKNLLPGKVPVKYRHGNEFKLQSVELVGINGIKAILSPESNEIMFQLVDTEATFSKGTVRLTIDCDGEELLVEFDLNFAVR